MMSMADGRSVFLDSLEKHRKVVEAMEAACRKDMDTLCRLVAEALQAGQRIFFFGNGGSAADAQHLATELSVRFIKDRRALPGLALTTDSSLLTACANDLGFHRIFARQIEALGQTGDIALAISTSGNSQNVLEALECAKQKGLIAAALTGRGGGKLRGVADPLVVVPSDETARVQEMHILLGHILCAEVERRLGLA